MARTTRTLFLCVANEISPVSKMSLACPIPGMAWQTAQIMLEIDVDE
jgi:hypothetical protein